MKLALGPILYYWARDTRFTFYDEIADSPVDIVYLGETRLLAPPPAAPEDWLEVADSSPPPARKWCSPARR